MKKFKVVHFITPFLFHTGSWIYSQLTGLKNFSNFVFTQKRENPQQFPWSEVYSAEEMSFHKRFLTKIYRKLRGDHYGLFFNDQYNKIKPHLLHAHMGYEAARWIKFIKTKKASLITTFYGHDVSKLGKIPYWRYRYEEIFEFGKYFLAEGSFLKKQIQLLGCQEDKILVQHLGVDLNKYPLKIHSEQIDGNQITLLQVSTFREKKGIEYTFRALKMLTTIYPKIKLNLIGQGDDSIANEKIAKLIAELKLNDNVSLLGIKSHVDTILEMLKADIFIHPSVTSGDGDSEGGAPVGIIEASAVGLPIISSYHADIPEVVLDGVTGLLSAERDFENLAANIEKLIKEPEQRIKFGLNGRAHINKNYNLTNQIMKLEEIYLMAING